MCNSIGDPCPDTGVWTSTSSGAKVVANRLPCTGSGYRPRRRGAVVVDLRVVLVVPDEDRGKGSHGSPGWRPVADFRGDGSFGVVQLTSPSSACSVILGSEVTDWPADYLVDERSGLSRASSWVSA